MNKLIKPIEEFFFARLLIIGLVGISIVASVDFYFADGVFNRSLRIDSIILFSIFIAYCFMRFGKFTVAVLSIAVLLVAAMFFQSITSPKITSSSMAVVMLVGFGYSLLLKRAVVFTMQAITLSGMIFVFGWQALHPHDYSTTTGIVIVTGVTYVILFSIISTASWILKERYNEALQRIAEKTNEIEAQNEELVQSQETLNELNVNLEKLVGERAEKILHQNTQLRNYAYANAHHVRGPLARLLGLVQLSKIDASLNYPFLFEKIEEQAIEIDNVIKSINEELEK
jgi:signal transduction histidine kinase